MTTLMEKVLPCRRIQALFSAANGIQFAGQRAKDLHLHYLCDGLRAVTDCFALSQMESKFQSEMDRTLYGAGTGSDSGVSETGVSHTTPPDAAALGGTDPSLPESPSHFGNLSGVDDSVGVGGGEDPNPLALIDQGEEDLSFTDNAEGDWGAGLV